MYIDTVCTDEPVQGIGNLFSLINFFTITACTDSNDAESLFQIG